MDIDRYFNIAIEKEASDLHLVAGAFPAIRIFGELQSIDNQILQNTDLKKQIYETLNKDQIERFENEWELDYVYQVDGSRFRVNLHYQLEQIGLAARFVPGIIPTPEEIRLENIIYELTHLNQGFILVTGPTGSGKSTTLATMINVINEERPAHIITLEDPVEFVYPNKKSVIEQREVGKDTRSFHAGLKYILRQDPNVILIGEMRDPETIAAALTAAETGHLVLSTLHTNSAAETVERIIDSFDPYRQRQILIQLAASLRAVVTQQLIPTKDGKVTVAREIMINTSAVSNLIRQNKIAQLVSVMQTGKREGMKTMGTSLKELYDAGEITEETLKHRQTNSEKMASYF